MRLNACELSRDWYKLSEVVEVAIFPEMTLLEALLWNTLSIRVFEVGVILARELIVG